jgi:hypothetical protein
MPVNINIIIIEQPIIENAPLIKKFSNTVCGVLPVSDTQKKNSHVKPIVILPSLNAAQNVLINVFIYSNFSVIRVKTKKVTN